MEALGLGTILIIVGIMAYYGIFGVVEKIAKMGDTEIDKLANEQVKRHNEWYAENPLDVETATAAAEQRALYKAIREGKIPQQKAKA